MRQDYVEGGEMNETNRDNIIDLMNENTRLRAEVANAVEAYKKSLKPVAWKDTIYTTGPDESRRENEPVLLGYEGWEGLPDGTELYRLDGGNDDAA